MGFNTYGDIIWENYKSRTEKAHILPDISLIMSKYKKYKLAVKLNNYGDFNQAY